MPALAGILSRPIPEGMFHQAGTPFPCFRIPRVGQRHSEANVPEALPVSDVRDEGSRPAIPDLRRCHAARAPQAPEAASARLREGAMTAERSVPARTSRARPLARDRRKAQAVGVRVPAALRPLSAHPHGDNRKMSPLAATGSRDKAQCPFGRLAQPPQASGDASPEWAPRPAEERGPGRRAPLCSGSSRRPPQAFRQGRPCTGRRRRRPARTPRRGRPGAGARSSASGRSHR